MREELKAAISLFFPINNNNAIVRNSEARRASNRAIKHAGIFYFVMCRDCASLLFFLIVRSRWYIIAPGKALRCHFIVLLIADTG
jgi:hypothetical protein